MVVISFNAGNKFRLFMTTGRAPDVARGDIFRHPSDAKARLLWTRFTDAGLARRPLRLTPEVNSGYLRPSAGLLTSPGAPER